MSKSKTINEDIDALFSRPVILPRRSFLSAGAAMSAATLLGSTAAVAKDAKSAGIDSLPVTEKELGYMKQAIDLMRRAIFHIVDSSFHSVYTGAISYSEETAMTIVRVPWW